MHKSITFAISAVAAFVSLAPAIAQDGAALGTRPIARTEVIAGVKRLFATMDTNHDGVVSQQEFAVFRARQGAGDADGAGMFGRVGSHWFDRADANGDGKVTLAEAQVRPLQLFDMADANHDGVVSVEEQKVAMMLMKLGGH
jgi:hypothetical protein